MWVFPTDILFKSNLTNYCMCAQITGKELQGMSLEVVREILPERTRAECKLLVRRIGQLQAISEVFVCLCAPL